MPLWMRQYLRCRIAERLLRPRCERLVSFCQLRHCQCARRLRSPASSHRRRPLWRALRESRGKRLAARRPSKDGLFRTKDGKLCSFDLKSRWDGWSRTLKCSPARGRTNDPHITSSIYRDPMYSRLLLQHVWACSRRRCTPSQFAAGSRKNPKTACAEG
ncbi:hypothetical protein K431DRAFT_147967 [Polychaeton citri CBS 116435]|uniref:Uncharacterized protein n=1 Tax=Polychaeton citri CBS 116435 TaxID=1314669 RepID=A0A9P4Q1M8_9PEZI|nr:hypothetical protein K431DRAFT_147967 [Polychaeton citri CBS 116435]